jgi:HEAT repeat protein
LLTDEEVLARVPAPRPKAPQPDAFGLASIPEAGPIDEDFAARADEPGVDGDSLALMDELPELPAPPLEHLFSPIITPADVRAVSAESVSAIELPPEDLALDVDDAESPDVNWQPATPHSAGGACENDLAALVAQLSSADVQERVSALETLALTGAAAQSAEADVRTCFTDSDPTVRAYAAWAHWELTGAASDPLVVLIDVLSNDHDADTAAFCCYVLGAMAGQAEPAIPVLMSLRTESSQVVQIHAAEALLRIAPQDAGSLDVLTAALSADDPQTRALAAVALNSAVGHKQQAVQSLIGALQDDSGVVRASAALTLGGFGADARSAVDSLLLAAGSEDRETRDAVQTALACIPVEE